MMHLKSYNKLIKSIIAIVLFLFSSIFAIIPSLVFKLDLNNLTASQEAYISIFDNIVLIIIYIIMFKKELKEEFLEYKNNFNSNMDIGFKYWIVGLFFMVISNFIILKLIPGSSSNNEEAIQAYIKNFPILSIISISILGPFIEEIVFRKAFKNIFNNNFIFIIISALVFGLMHVIGQESNIYQYLYIVPYGALGASFAYMYYKSDTMFTSYTMHFIHNLALTIISIITISL